MVELMNKKKKSYKCFKIGKKNAFLIYFLWGIILHKRGYIYI